MKKHLKKQQLINQTQLLLINTLWSPSSRIFLYFIRLADNHLPGKSKIVEDHRNQPCMCISQNTRQVD